MEVPLEGWCPEFFAPLLRYGSGWQNWEPDEGREAMEPTKQRERWEEVAVFSLLIRNVLLSACHPRREIWAEADIAL